MVLFNHSARVKSPRKALSLVDSYSGLVKRNRSLVAKRDQTHSIRMQTTPSRIFL